MKIDLLELKHVVGRIFDHIIKTRGVRYCEIEKDYYWHIPEEEKYIAETPKDLNMGRLPDDWEFLSYLLDPEEQPLANQLTEVAPILRYLGESLGRELGQYGG